MDFVLRPLAKEFHETSGFPLKVLLYYNPGIQTFNVISQVKGLRGANT